MAYSDVVVRCVCGGGLFYSSMIKSQSLVSLCPSTVTFTNVAVTGRTYVGQGDYRGLALGILHLPGQLG